MSTWQERNKKVCFSCTVADFLYYHPVKMPKLLTAGEKHTQICIPVIPVLHLNIQAEALLQGRGTEAKADAVYELIWSIVSRWFILQSVRMAILLWHCLLKTPSHIATMDSQGLESRLKNPNITAVFMVLTVNLFQVFFSKQEKVS